MNVQLALSNIQRERALRDYLAMKGKYTVFCFSVDGTRVTAKAIGKIEEYIVGTDAEVPARMGKAIERGRIKLIVDGNAVNVVVYRIS
jgi:hypothetical protein